MIHVDSEENVPTYLSLYGDGYKSKAVRVDYQK